MQIDFHHATTYVLARLAGFEHPEANIIAYSAQYVDDATNSGLSVLQTALCTNILARLIKHLITRILTN